MTHDVDAVSKTAAIRMKQSIFMLVNAISSVFKVKSTLSGELINNIFRMIFGSENWWKFDRILLLEKISGIKATYHFHVDFRKKTMKRWLLDPGYDIRDPKLLRLLKQILEDGHIIGIHPSFDAWSNSALIAKQKKDLEDLLGKNIEVCRQHWLRFSWAQTWAAQENATLNLDTTLMFNDRPGFRNSAAITWHPWNQIKSTRHSIMAMSTILMDSHLYDYEMLDAFARKKKMHYLISECQAVAGCASVLWHPHTLSKDYGWSEGFEELIDLLSHAHGVNSI